MTKIPSNELTKEMIIVLAKEVIKRKYIIGTLDTNTTIRILELLVEKIELKE